MISPENQKRLALGGSLAAFALAAIAINHIGRKYNEDLVKENQAVNTQISGMFIDVEQEIYAVGTEIGGDIQRLNGRVDGLETRVSIAETAVPPYLTAEGTTVYTRTPTPTGTPSLP